MRKILQGIVYLALGGVFVGVGIKTQYKYKKLTQTFKQTKGKVVQLVPVKNRKNVVYPKINFQDETGKTYSHTSGLTFTTRQISVGDTLLLLYNPKNPQEIFIYNNFNRNWLPLMLIMVGGVFLLLGGVGLYRLVRTKGEAK